jgi:hypothetical protein
MPGWLDRVLPLIRVEGRDDHEVVGTGRLRLGPSLRRPTSQVASTTEVA